MKKALLALIVLPAMFFTGCMDTPQAGQIGVVRNGGPFDNHNVRQIITPGSGNTWTGFGSTTHFYPADTQQRYYTISANASDGDKAGVDVVTVPTSDGVHVGLEGTFYFTTAFNDSKAGLALLKGFDNAFGTRQFDGKYPWEDGGWSRFLDKAVRPVIDNNLREVIGGFSCTELVASCALVQRGNDGSVPQNKSNQSNIQAIQDAINEGMANDVVSTLRAPYFAQVRFNLARVTLPGQVQDAIDRSQAAFAAVSQARAKVQAAKQESLANETRQKGYLKCPTCAKIDAIKALPQGLTALGGNFAVGVK